MSIYNPIADALGIEYIPAEIITHQVQEEIVFYDSTLASIDAIKRNSEFVECPVCGVIGNRPNMMRWHFDNCKTKPRHCKQCEGVIPRQGCKESVYRRKIYCSNVCYNESKKGKTPIVMTEEVRKKISVAAKLDGHNRSVRMKQNEVWKKSGRWKT